ncbi:MAG: hypothetical protein EYR95_18615 [Phormidium sp. SL48-SHIP]|nr:MAG: hypothetical protein EYR95_18615 [Phormidium sp. SL48-SHIP]
MHHVVPKVLGGNEGSNVVPLCESCHGLVHSRGFLSHSVLTKRGLEKAKAKGVKLGGNRGNIDKANAASREKADNHAAKVMDTILPLRQAGKTLQQIADTLNKTGVTTARGGKWHPTTVKNVLDRA